MSSYPPPPPPPPPGWPGGQYPPPYDPRFARAQRRALRDQAKLQRMQMRAQMRASRRGSIVGPLLILALGVVFLLSQTGRLSWTYTLNWYSRWWPAVLILAGLLLLAEWFIDQHRQQVAGQPVARTIGPGVIFLIVILALIGASADGIQKGIDWRDHAFASGYSKLDHVFGDRHDAYDTVSSAIGEGATLVVHNPHGDVTVTGSSTDGQVHVSAHKQAYAWNDTDANHKAQTLQPIFSAEGKDVVLTVAAIEGGDVDLTIELPRGNPVTLDAGHGDVRVSEVHAAVTLSANHGDVDLSAITGPLSVHVNDDDASLSVKSLTGSLLIEGRSGDVNVADVTGDTTLQGDFFGTTHVEHINGVFRFQSSRTQFEVARVDGSFEIENKNLQANDLAGPLILKTHDKEIELDRVQGSVQVTNRNGAVAVTQVPPLAAVQIQNEHGSVDVGLPSGAGFVLNATTRNGDLENDFGLTAHDNDSTHSLQQAVGGGGPTVSINTTDGDLTLRKSSVAPLPPAPPAPPKITTAPVAPKAPKAAAAPKAPMAPKVPDVMKPAADPKPSGQAS